MRGSDNTGEFVIFVISKITAASQRQTDCDTLVQMRQFALALAITLAASAATADETIQAFGHSWSVQQASDWSVENGTLRLKVSGEPAPGQPRRPQKFAILDSKPYKKVTIEAEMKHNGRSLIIVYGYQDKDHYNYAHISSDEAVKQNVHNGFFHVFNGERSRISSLDGPASFTTAEWTPVKFVFDGDTGRAYVEVNGKKNPSLEAVDLSLRWGKIGFGSFNETGDFRNVKFTGETREPGPFGRQ